MKTAIFIDGGYLDQILKKEYNRASIDYAKLSKEISNNNLILRTYYYHCPPYQSNPPTDAERTRVSNTDRFHASLNRLPKFQVRLGRLAKRDGKVAQKGVDTLLSVDMVTLAATRQISDAILSAGDYDFIPAITVAKEHGVNITLYHSKEKGSYHDSLWNICDMRHSIDQTLIDNIKRR